MRSTRAHSPLTAAPIAAAVAALVTACSSGTGPAQHAAASSRAASPAAAAATSGASASPSASLDPAAQAALSSYTKMWQTVQADASGGSYNILGLSAYVTGKPLQLFSENLANWHAEGAVIRGEMVMSPSVAGETPAAAPTAVQITDHFDDSHALLYYSATGALVNDKPGGCHLVHAAVTDMRGVWRVTSLDIGAAGTCPP
jgi:hypothetical protein